MARLHNIPIKSVIPASTHVSINYYGGCGFVYQDNTSQLYGDMFVENVIENESMNVRLFGYHNQWNIKDEHMRPRIYQITGRLAGNQLVRMIQVYNDHLNAEKVANSGDQIYFYYKDTCLTGVPLSLNIVITGNNLSGFTMNYLVHQKNTIDGETVAPSDELHFDKKVDRIEIDDIPGGITISELPDMDDDVYEKLEKYFHIRSIKISMNARTFITEDGVLVSYGNTPNRISMVLDTYEAILEKTTIAEQAVLGIPAEEVNITSRHMETTIRRALIGNSENYDGLEMTVNRLTFNRVLFTEMHSEHAVGVYSRAFRVEGYFDTIGEHVEEMEI